MQYVVGRFTLSETDKRLVTGCFISQAVDRETIVYRDELNCRQHQHETNFLLGK